MKDVQITCNTKGKVDIDCNVKANGVSIALVDEKHIPMAKYHFDSTKIDNIERICYTANNYKAYFDITPTVIFENIPSKI